MIQHILPWRDAPSSAAPGARPQSFRSFRSRNVVPLKQFQRLLGHMASAAAVTPHGLLHMRPLQYWLHSWVPRWAWRRGTLRVGITQQCRRFPQPLDGTCLSTGRGAPRTSVPAYCCHNRCLQHGLGCYMHRAGSLGALDRAPTALAHQLPRAVGREIFTYTIFQQSYQDICDSRMGTNHSFELVRFN